MKSKCESRGESRKKKIEKIFSYYKIAEKDFVFYRSEIIVFKKIN